MLTAHRWTERVFKLTAVATLLIALGTLAALLIDALIDGVGRLNWQFLTSFPSRKPEQAGILSALAGTTYMMILTAAFALPMGVGAAIYLEEYARRHWFSRVIEVNIANLAGVPSIIYGLLGLELFVRAMGLGRSLLAGALTMALLVLPIIIISAREALRAVPPSILEASYALGASRWQTIWNQVLPLAFPGILTGSILAFSRAIGEAAPLITMGALTYVAFLPDGLLAPFTALPIQIFNWVSRPQKGFFTAAAAGIIVLLVVLLLMNALAVYLRQRYQKRLYL
jgi:phosphate transport system permease protein